MSDQGYLTAARLQPPQRPANKTLRHLREIREIRQYPFDTAITGS